MRGLLLLLLEKMCPGYREPETRKYSCGSRISTVVPPRPGRAWVSKRGGREVYRRLGPEQCSLSVREGTPLLLLKERERGGAGVRGRRVERLGSSNRRRAEFVCLHAVFACGSGRLAQ